MIRRILRENGYTLVEGKESVLEAIKSVADNSVEKLCSGYGVFPNGEPCKGCADCEEKLK